MVDTVTGPGGGATETIYSLQRLQPYRGGQAVPALPIGAGAATQDPRYGFTEQTAPATGGSMRGQYGNSGSQTAGSAGPNSTGVISHTLGSANSPMDAKWDYLPFNDRDFTSVAELLMVPGCPPGLFTKMFCETVPPVTASTLYTTPPGTTAGAPAAPTTFAATTASPPIPHTFPYLVDEFFYTAASTEYVPPAPSFPAPS